MLEMVPGLRLRTSGKRPRWDKEETLPARHGGEWISYVLVQVRDDVFEDLVVLLGELLQHLFERVQLLLPVIYFCQDKSNIGMRQRNIHDPPGRGLHATPRPAEPREPAGTSGGEAHQDFSAEEPSTLEIQSPVPEVGPKATCVSLPGSVGSHALGAPGRPA